MAKQKDKRAAQGEPRQPKPPDAAVQPVTETALEPPTHMKVEPGPPAHVIEDQ